MSGVFNNKCELDEGVLSFSCPHCRMMINVGLQELACCIFRHGYYCRRNEAGDVVELINQIGPHDSKEICDTLVKQPNIVGCCRPFQIVQKENHYFVEICDYI
jgi:hypothetical protein